MKTFLSIVQLLLIVCPFLLVLGVFLGVRYATKIHALLTNIESHLAAIRDAGAKVGQDIKKVF